MLDVAIIGAGPYGLSLASHLRTRNVRFRIFGKPMQAWRAHMPQSMFLKSLGDSSDFSDPQNAFTTHHFYAERRQPYASKDVIPLSDFIAYGLEFQKRLAPETEPHEVVSVESDGQGYALRLSNQEIVHAKQVVVAAGVYPFRYLPPVLAALPPAFCTHSAEYGPIDNLRGKKVAVIGSGASAVDLALELAEQNVDVVVISRRAKIPFQNPPSAKEPPFLMRLLAPDSGIGGGWRNKICADMPQIIAALPAALRAYIVRTRLGPAPGWFTRERVERIPMQFGRTVRSAEVADGKVRLTLAARDGSTQSLDVDHVVGATGYRTDLKNLPFLAESIRQKIRTYDDSPLLSRWFESSCPGIYFIGQAAAMSFGPVMRFVYGASFTMKRIVKRLARASAVKNPSSPNIVSDFISKTA